MIVSVVVEFLLNSTITTMKYPFPAQMNDRNGKFLLIPTFGRLFPTSFVDSSYSCISHHLPSSVRFNGEL